MVLAHRLAMESLLVQADMVEANEFYDLAMRYNVSGVPLTTINGNKGGVLGAVPEEELVQEVLRVSSEIDQK